MIPYCNNYEKLIIFLKLVIKIVSYWILTFCRFSRTLNAARVTLETFTHRTIKTTVNGGTERRNLLNCKKLRKSRISKLGDHNSVPNPKERTACLKTVVLWKHAVTVLFLKKKIMTKVERFWKYWILEDGLNVIMMRCRCTC